MELIIVIIVILIVGALLFLAARYVMEAVGLPQPFHNIILALIIVVTALWIAQTAGLF